MLREHYAAIGALRMAIPPLTMVQLDHRLGIVEQALAGLGVQAQESADQCARLVRRVENLGAASPLYDGTSLVLSPALTAAVAAAVQALRTDRVLRQSVALALGRLQRQYKQGPLTDLLAALVTGTDDAPEVA